MLIPASHIAVLALLSAAEYLYRFYSDPIHRYASLGKAIGRLLLAGTYLFIALDDPTEAVRMVLVRWSLFMFFFIDLFFIVQRHITDRILSK
jgi:hypothetical protein